jgi:hypothetical protein
VDFYNQKFFEADFALAGAVIVNIVIKAGNVQQGINKRFAVLKLDIIMPLIRNKLPNRL